MDLNIDIYESMRERIFKGVLNRLARKRSFNNWKEMKTAIGYKEGSLVEEGIRMALQKVNWQHTL